MACHIVYGWHDSCWGILTNLCVKLLVFNDLQLRGGRVIVSSLSFATCKTPCLPARSVPSIRVDSACERTRDDRAESATPECSP